MKMILITGGAFQGKTQYVLAHTNYNIVDGSLCSLTDLKSTKILHNYHILIRRLMETDSDAVMFTKQFYTHNPDCIVILNEIGCGIIPMDKNERIWRETVGTCGCILAEHASSVIRLVCGIPIALKGDLL